MLFAMALVFSNCKKDNSSAKCDDTKYYHYLSVADKAKVAYTGKDSLVYISNNNDTAICIGQGITQFFVTSSKYANPDCPPIKDYYEAFNFKFISNNSNFKIDLSLYRDDGYGLETIHAINNKMDYRIYLVDINNKEISNFIDC